MPPRNNSNLNLHEFHLKLNWISIIPTTHILPTLKKIHYTWHKNDDPSIKLYLPGGINKSNKRTINIDDSQSLKEAKVFLEKHKNTIATFDFYVGANCFEYYMMNVKRHHKNCAKSSIPLLVDPLWKLDMGNGVKLYNKPFLHVNLYLFNRKKPYHRPKRKIK